MRDPDDVFHLAIPCHNLDEASAFYVDGLGCRLARRYPDRITLDFFGDQVVCHLSPEDVDSEPRMYPRHFGVTFRSRSDFEAVYKRATAARLPFFQDRFVRFGGRREQHTTFFLRDPSNNLLEFKHYDDPEMMY
jgi:extradiol dioxygenase family protein